jgi:hypothetical protein
MCFIGHFFLWGFCGEDVDSLPRGQGLSTVVLTVLEYLAVELGRSRFEQRCCELTPLFFRNRELGETTALTYEELREHEDVWSVQSLES